MKMEKDILKLGSYDLDHIFSGIKDTEKSYDNKESLRENFNFELKCRGLIDKEKTEIMIPKNVKYPNLKNKFQGYEDLYLFMYENRDNTMVSPYYGEDLLIKKNGE